MSFVGGADGESPQAPLVQATNGNFYGTTYQGGTAGVGTVFEVTSGGVFTAIHSFTNGLDGAFPAAGLTLGTNGDLYGTTFLGGSQHVGTFFKITAQGALTVLYSFLDDVANKPMGGLVLGTNGNFYGTTYGGGESLTIPYPFGTIFEMTATGKLTRLYSFTNGFDGAYPQAGLTLGSDGNFYGTTTFAGLYTGPYYTLPTYGTIFKITPTGALTPIYAFTNGVDGAVPLSQLVQWTNGNFYGTASSGGANGHGTVFEISPAGAFTPIYSFTNGIDGATPDAGLVVGADGNLYGTASAGGSYRMGTVFEISGNGSFAPLLSFQGTNDGAMPMAPLVLGSNGNLYGTTSLDSAANGGTAFEIELPTTAAPQFTSIAVGSPLVTVTWSTVAGQMYQLQVATNLNPAGWANLGAPYAGTNGFVSYPDSRIGNQRFYRVFTYSQ
jgi:uncharacterized repeat protein (TIGR03803 family)